MPERIHLNGFTLHDALAGLEPAQHPRVALLVPRSDRDAPPVYRVVADLDERIVAVGVIPGTSAARSFISSTPPACRTSCGIEFAV
jgi:hypothetical protein